MQSPLLSYVKKRWPLWVVLVVFTCLKWPHLFYPFYCDEGWVYAPAIKTMALHGPSLMPGSLPENLSRGHPLFFHFLGASWIRVFGASNFSIHFFAYTITLLLLVALFEVMYGFFGRRAAALSLLLVATQIIFFAEAAFLYPEMLVCLLTFLGIYFYAKDRLLLTTLVLAMLFLTKESGLLFGLVIGCHAAVSLFRKTDTLKLRILRVLSVLISIVPTILFYMLQKQKLGWYILPMHEGMINTKWSDYYNTFLDDLHWTFWINKANFVLALLVIALSLVPATRYRRVSYFFPLLPAFVIYLLSIKSVTDHHKAGMGLIVLFVLFFIVATNYVLRLKTAINAHARRFISLAGISIPVYVLYASLSVVGARYNLVAVLLTMIFLAICLDIYISAVGNRIMFAAVAGILLVCGYAIRSDESNSDASLEAFHACKVHMKVVAFMEDHDVYDKKLSVECYWGLWHFTDTLEGFLRTNRVFTKVKHFPPDTSAAFAVIDNICGSEDTVERRAMIPNFHLVEKIKESRSWAEIYEHN